MIDVRITPAYAGNTKISRQSPFMCQDHPRLRGEHSPTQVKAVKCIGSPPPTRGTLARCLPKWYNYRITPAYAGNTKVYFKFCSVVQDHPRLRGEHANIYYSRCNIKGSPPPTRGTPADAVKEQINKGITPAYAGNTIGLQVEIKEDGDHPRLRGEHMRLLRICIMLLGSPPPTRGTQ